MPTTDTVIVGTGAEAIPAPRLDHLRALEAESIAIMREVVAEFGTP